MIKPTNKTLLMLMTFLFFAWGFITCLNDILVPHLKALFHLNYAEALLVQFCFFTAYAVMSIPVSKIVTRLGYKRSILLGLLTLSAGCWLFLSAASYKFFPLFLLALFVLASGIVVLQIAANPCVTLLGNSATASSRLTFTQALNSLGYTLAPLLVGSLIISYSVQIPYIFIAVILLVLSGTVAFFAFPNFDRDLNTAGVTQSFNLWQSPQLIFGALAIFMYVGAEVATGSLTISYLGLSAVAALPAIIAAKFLSIYWGGAMVGRFIGSWVLTFVRPNQAIAFNAIMAIILLMLSLLATGHMAMGAILMLGLFNSIMFPTIFALTIADMGKLRTQAAGIICTAVVGGAIIPELQGILADHVGLKNSFALLIICYGFIFCYAISSHRRNLSVMPAPDRGPRLASSKVSSLRGR